MKQSFKPYLIFIFVLLLIVFQIFVSNRLADYGQKISKLTQQTNDLTLENQRIKKKIASSSALTNLNQKAKELGFTQKAQIYYLDEPYPIAQNPL